MLVLRSLRSVRKLSTLHVSHTAASTFRQELKVPSGITQWGYGQHAANLPKSIAHSSEPLKVSMLVRNGPILHNAKSL